MKVHFKDLLKGDFFIPCDFVDEEGNSPIYQKICGQKSNNSYNAVLLNTGVLVNVSDRTEYCKVKVEFSIHNHE